MSDAMFKKDLSPSRQRFVERCQHLNHGTYEGLVFQDGEPVLDPPPRIVRDFKFGGDNSPRPEWESPDFVLKAQFVELFRYFEKHRNGVIQTIEVKHGLPFLMRIAETVNS